MQTNKYIIGIDIGTTSTKAVLFDEKGTLIKQTNVEYPLYHDQPDMAEQEPEEIFQAVVENLKEVSSGVENIAAVSFSSAMHSLILLDKDKNPLTRSMTWADNRAKKYAQELKNSQLGQEIYQATGTPIHSMAPLSKIIWLREEKPELFAKVAWFIGIKEYVFYRLFDELKMDQSVASATGMFNIHEKKWDNKALATAGITEEKLPQVVLTSYQFRNLQVDVGLTKDTPFVVGATDGVLSNLGVNAMEKGSLALTIGTSGALRTVSKEPILDSTGRTFCYLLDEEFYVSGGAVNNGGIIFRWLRDTLYDGKVDYTQALEFAKNVPAGAKGLLFLPYLNGERAPLWNENARGSYFGLSQSHTKEDMLRAGLEGILFNLYQVYELLAISEAKAIQATGGFTRAPFLCQMIADIFNQPVSVPASVESSCLGAAVVAMKSLGMIDDLTHIENMVGVHHTYQPNPENAVIYQKLYPLFASLSKNLAEEYEKIASLQVLLSKG